MRETELVADVEIEERLALRLRTLRAERQWSLDELAARSGTSRATLSRLEKGEVGATAATLARLCSAYGLTLSRLMHMVEGDFVPLVARDAQPVWQDAESGQRRRVVSPPSHVLAGEVVESELPPGTEIAYDRPPRAGLEHHLLMLDGTLSLEIEGTSYTLGPGDCLRYRLYGPSRFRTGPAGGARYLIFMV